MQLIAVREWRPRIVTQRAVGKRIGIGQSGVAMRVHRYRRVTGQHDGFRGRLRRPRIIKTLQLSLFDL